MDEKANWLGDDPLNINESNESDGLPPMNYDDPNDPEWAAFIERLQSFVPDRMPDLMIVNPKRVKFIFGIVEKIKAILDDECLTYDIRGHRPFGSTAYTVEIVSGAYFSVGEENKARFAEIISHANNFAVDLSDKNEIILSLCFSDVFIDASEE